MSLRKGDHYRGRSSAFLFVRENLDISFYKGRLIIEYGCHIDGAAGIHSKLFCDVVR